MAGDERRNESAADRVEEARELLNDITDPCSQAAAVPLGLIDMGIVRDVSVHDETVTVEILPTFPACRFVPIFELEIERRLGELQWVSEVAVRIAPPDVIWDESRLSQAARLRLAERRRDAEHERPTRQPATRQGR
jgi:metal-sulfur cluster biosynthetic enzyme